MYPVGSGWRYGYLCKVLPLIVNDLQFFINKRAIARESGFTLKRQRN